MQFKRLAHGFSLLLSLVFGIMLLSTSTVMASLYTKYCDKDYYYNNNDFSAPYHYYNQAECDQNEKHFLILPLFGYFTLGTWVRLIVSYNDILTYVYNYMYPYYPPKSYFIYLLI